MAQRIRLGGGPVLNQENLGVRATKMAPNALPVRRAALGEVGINSVHLNQNVALKKLAKSNDPATHVLKKPEENAMKKLNVHVPAKPTVRKKITSNETEKASKQVTIKRQESVLNQKALPKTNDTVSYSSKQLSGVVDADAKDADDPLLVTEYIMDIYEYLREMELKYSLRAGFLNGSKSTPRMRTVLVNWIVEVHVNFKFLLETLHLTVSILDRYLQLSLNVGRDSLQLVGTSAMLIAAKYEEIYAPELQDFVYICDDCFSKKQILDMEFDILKKLEFSLGKPLALHFLRRYNKVASVKPEQHTLAKYLIEICLLEYELCHIRPSLQAAAACCLAISILDEVDDPSTVWTNTLVYYTTYKYSQIKPVVIDLAAGLVKQETTKFKVIKKKYESSENGKISTHPNLKGALVKKLSAQSALKK